MGASVGTRAGSRVWVGSAVGTGVAARVGTGEGIGVFGLGSGVGDGVATGFAVSVCDGDAVTAVTSNGYNCFAEPR